VLIASHACATPQNQRLFALAAAERNWHVTMCLPEFWLDEYGNQLPAKLLDGFNAEVVPVPVIRNGSVPLHAYRGRLSRLLRQIAPDIIYSHNEAYALSTMQWCWANERTLCRPFGFFSCQNLDKRYPPPFRQGERWVYNKSRFFFPITKAVEEVHRAKGYSGTSTILPLGYDPAVFRPSVSIRERHARATGRPVRLGYIGRVVEEKGLVTLAQALEQIRDEEWELKIAGGGPYENEVKGAMRAAKVADRVEWIGMVPRDEVPQFYESIDLLMLPSETRKNWKEQFGRVILESMACGTPVVGSDSGEIPRLIKETRGGWVFPEAHPDALASTLREAIHDTNRRGEIAEHSARYVLERYTLPALAVEFADAIENAAGL